MTNVEIVKIKVRRFQRPGWNQTFIAKNEIRNIIIKFVICLVMRFNAEKFKICVSVIWFRIKM